MNPFAVPFTSEVKRKIKSAQLRFIKAKNWFIRKTKETDFIAIIINDILKNVSKIDLELTDNINFLSNVSFSAFFEKTKKIKIEYTSSV